MSKDDKLLTVFVRQIESLQQEKKVIDDKITTLSLAYEVMAGESLEASEDEPTTRKSGRRTLDKQGISKTLAFMESKKRPVTNRSVARYFKISPGATSQRLYTLMRKGLVERVERNTYRVTSKSSHKEAAGE